MARRRRHREHFDDGVYDDYDDYAGDYVEEEVIVYEEVRSSRSKILAGLLQIFFGWMGLGRFYLGYTGYGIAMFISSMLSLGMIGSVWGLIDGIRIIMGDVPDADGLSLRD
ncbi:MAG: hypothetical protein CL920_28690 [Deltaproteobacteria bacterium]|nr:hypothetical protein [Deltaproteobacteria bacterium]MBU52694.1 hypothetical protein [Deltaproteobacteria bacterium]|tara:strand:- start:5673 stop:6005 length:333 start_codon:yes stop_codon:yes gene_type:complete